MERPEGAVAANGEEVASAAADAHNVCEVGDEFRCVRVPGRCMFT